MIRARACAKAGCSKTVVGCGSARYCEGHEPKRDHMYEQSKRNPVIKRLYIGPSWGALRKLSLTREPLCRLCAKVGDVTPATVVDHIKPHRGDVLLFNDTDNLQSLCVNCHNRKTGLGM